MSQRWSLAALALAAGLVHAQGAEAFCRTNSCDTKLGDVCTEDADGCLQGGVPLYWPSSCVSFAVHQGGSPNNDITALEFEAVIRQAFDTWQGADCGGGKTPSIHAEGLGLLECDQVEYNLKAGNANIYVFRDEVWPDDDNGVSQRDVLALTTVWHDHRTGMIRDVDVEVNGTSGDVTIGDLQDGADLLSIVTHETGHFLGLDHSRSAAVMTPSYLPGTDDLRTLRSDDEAGICAVYPPDHVADSDSCTPRRGFSTICDPPEPDDGGCTLVVPFQGSSANGFWLGLIPFALVLGRRALRRR